MKEFQTKTGGRYLFNEDFENLQELALSSHSIFEDCGGNFIVYGIRYNETLHKFSRGLVWLAGKLREVSASIFDQNYSTYYIVPDDREYTAEYENGEVHVTSVEYGARITITKPSSGEYIQSSDGGFVRSKREFWEYYAFSKSFVPNVVGGSQYFPDDVYFNGNVLQYSQRHGDIRVKSDDGDLGLTFPKFRSGGAPPSPTIRRRMLIANRDGDISETLSDAMGYHRPDPDSDTVYGSHASGEVYLENVIAKMVNGGLGSFLNAKSIYINGQNILDRYFTIEEYGDTGWKGIIDTNTNRPLTNLFARRIYNSVFIQGTLPSDFFKRQINQSSFSHLTHYKLPDGIPMPNEDTPSAIYNFVHLHTTAFCTLRQQGQESDEQCTVGCAVMISANSNSRGTFEIRRHVNNGRSDTLYDDSYPLFDSYKFIPLDTPEGVDMNVSWSYAVDAPLSASLVEHASGSNIAYNPDTHIIHCYCFSEVLVNGTVSEYTNYEVSKIEYTTDNYTISWDNDGIINWHRIDVVHAIDKNVKWYRYWNGRWVWQEGDANCPGYYFKTIDYIPEDVTCTIKVTFENGEFLTKSLIAYPQNYSIWLNVPRSSSRPDKARFINPETGKGQITRPNIECRKHYYYERFQNWSSYSISEGWEDGGSFEFVRGAEYIRKVDDHYEWTVAALQAREPFMVSVKKTITIDGETYEKYSSQTIDPAVDALTNDTEFVPYY